MAQIEMTPQEAEMLREILVRYLPELRREIVDTDKKEFRRYLQGMEVFMNDLIKRLQQKIAA
ncbi:MAG: hypothetical protein OS130_01065 [Thermodesulfobacteriota bacterium]|jgi:hypothetical protein|nr:MAG: hypothetical protein OS130_01065 [Thermodesulfobacteriota bacterium]